MIRPIVLALLKRGDSYLCTTGVEPGTGTVFTRPPGGGIEHGEHSEAALERELLEELGLRISSSRLIDVLENIFVFAGRRMHEIVFVYEVTADESAIAAIPSRVLDSGHPVQWRTLTSESVGAGTEASPILVPTGLLDLLQR